MMKKFVFSLLVAMPLTSFATPMTIDFSVTSTAPYAGFAAGTVGTGSFTFDDSIIDTTKTGWSDFQVGLVDPSLTFNWLGTSWNATNLQIWTIAWTSDGTVWSWGLGSPGGWCAQLNCVSSAGPTDFAMNASVAVLHIEGFSPWEQSDQISWSIRKTTVPEPASFALFGVGLASLAGLKRARRQSKAE